jgi:2-C-methyl-D-erythritol 2,4-cyclodiphosphate synthase
VRVGLGVDVHAFGGDGPLVLGGVVFDGEPGLRGHSDADAVAHAVTDALLGAAGLGDLGSRFPDTDPAWAGADSVGILATVVAEVTSLGWAVANADCSVVLEAPKLAPRRAAMEARLGEVLGAPIRITGRRPEGLGALGRGEGVTAMAVVLLERS